MTLQVVRLTTIVSVHYFTRRQSEQTKPSAQHVYMLNRSANIGVTVVWRNKSGCLKTLRGIMLHEGSNV